MTKKHFVALANAIRGNNGPNGYAEKFTERQIILLAYFCKAQNPRFDRARWIAYVNGEIEYIAAPAKGGV